MNNEFNVLSTVLGTLLSTEKEKIYTRSGTNNAPVLLQNHKCVIL